MITVYGAGKDNRVALWDRDEQHPDGEVFVVNDGKAYEVAETAAVKRALSDGRLTTERVNWNSGPQRSRVGRPRKEVAELRPATDAEEDKAGLTGFVEKDTAMVTEKPSRK